MGQIVDSQIMASLNHSQNESHSKILMDLWPNMETNIDYFQLIHNCDLTADGKPTSIKIS